MCPVDKASQKRTQSLMACISPTSTECGAKDQAACSSTITLSPTAVCSSAEHTFAPSFHACSLCPQWGGVLLRFVMLLRAGSSERVRGADAVEGKAQSAPTHEELSILLIIYKEPAFCFINFHRFLFSMSLISGFVSPSSAHYGCWMPCLLGS